MVIWWSGFFSGFMVAVLVGSLVVILIDTVDLLRERRERRKGWG